MRADTKGQRLGCPSVHTRDLHLHSPSSLHLSPSFSLLSILLDLSTPAAHPHPCAPLALPSRSTPADTQNQSQARSQARNRIQGCADPPSSARWSWSRRAQEARRGHRTHGWAGCEASYWSRSIVRVSAIPLSCSFLSARAPHHPRLPSLLAPLAALVSIRSLTPDPAPQAPRDQQRRARSSSSGTKKALALMAGRRHRASRRRSCARRRRAR